MILGRFFAKLAFCQLSETNASCSCVQGVLQCRHKAGHFFSRWCVQGGKGMNIQAFQPDQNGNSILRCSVATLLEYVHAHFAVRFTSDRSTSFSLCRRRNRRLRLPSVRISTAPVAPLFHAALVQDVAPVQGKNRSRKAQSLHCATMQPNYV